MIVLDTNVISEAMKPFPNPVVHSWLNEQVAETLYLSGVTLADVWNRCNCRMAGARKL